MVENEQLVDPLSRLLVHSVGRTNTILVVFDRLENWALRTIIFRLWLT